MKQKPNTRAIAGDLAAALSDIDATNHGGVAFSDCTETSWNLMLTLKKSPMTLKEMLTLINNGEVRSALAKAFNQGCAYGRNEALFIPGVHNDVESVSGYEMEKARSRTRNDDVYHTVINREMFKAQAVADEKKAKEWRSFLPKWPKVKAELIKLGVARATAQKMPRGWPGSRA